MSDLVKNNTVNTNRWYKSQTFILILIIIALSVVVNSINSNFFSASNIFAIFQQISVLGIVTMGVTILVMTGQLDLSVGGIISLACVIFVKISIAGYGIPLAIIITVLFCLGMGLLNGVIITKTKCPPLIITLGMAYVYNGISLVLTSGTFIALKEDFSALGRGSVFDVPFSMIIFIGVTILTFFILKYTRYGRRVTAIGGNPEVTYLAGINTNRYVACTYMINGAYVALASLVLVSRLGSVLAETGSGYELRSLAAAIIGGVSLNGGKGSAIGAFFGVILMGVLSNGMNLMNVNSYYQTMVLGIVIVAAVIISNVGNLRKKQ
ncbi:MAG: ABC transporter permease [Christensenellaceae bacterium]|nr:ABC transporter permease [Christensenellaceae bacterium]